MKQNDRELLERIREALKELREPSEIIDIDGTDTLTYPMGEDNELAARDCSINVVHFDDGYTALQIMATAFYGLDEKTAAVTERLLSPLNSLLSIGSFCLMPEEGCLYLNYAFLIDSMDESEMLFSLAVDLEVLTMTASRARELLLPLVNHEINPEDIKEDDFCISQLLG